MPMSMQCRSKCISGVEVKGELGIGPFREGDSLALECHVPGGHLCLPLQSAETFQSAKARCRCRAQDSALHSSAMW
jgi:hypothetical protein